MIPIMKALLLCDTVVLDQFTKKWSLYGLINAALMPEFPARCPKFSVYLSAGDVSGECVGKVRVLDPDLNQVAECVSQAITFRAGETLDFGAVFTAIPLQRPGIYSVEAIVNDQVVGTTRLDVVTAK